MSVFWLTEGRSLSGPGRANNMSTLFVESHLVPTLTLRTCGRRVNVGESHERCERRGEVNYRKYYMSKFIQQL